MAHDPLAYLWDAREACDAILEFVAGVDLHTYMATPLLHSAVERKFEIIGEALNQLSVESRSGSGGSNSWFGAHRRFPQYADSWLCRV